MKRENYVPDRGDLVWIDLNPTAGHEQAGRRPALVVSPKIYNRKTGLCLLCPATRKQKGYAFEVEYTDSTGTTSTILADHLRNVDWRARKIEKIERVTTKILGQVVAKLNALLIDPDV